jgi:hypothetical protein
LVDHPMAPAGDPPGLAVMVVQGEGIKSWTLSRPLPERRLLDLYHYTDRGGFEGLTSPAGDWLPSLGARSKPQTVSVKPVPGREDLFPQEPTASRQSMSSLLSTLIAVATAGPTDLMLDLSSRVYGPGWYMTSLEPDRQTDELVRILWSDNQTKRARTEFWVKIRVSEFKARTPNPLRPDLKFVPIGDARGIVGPPGEEELAGESLLSIDLLSAGSRDDSGRRRVGVATLYQEPRCLVPPFRFQTVGWPKFGSERKARVLEFLGFAPAARAVTPDSPEGKASDLVHNLVQQGRIEEALRSADELVARFPEVASLWSNRGVALALSGRRQEAIGCYVRALEIQPDYSQARVNLTASLIVLGRFAEAVSAVTDLLANDPGNADGWFNRGVALTNLREYAAAIESFDRFVALAPGHPRAARARELIQECRRRGRL